MRRVALCCRVLQSVAVCCSIHASCCSVLQSVLVCCSIHAPCCSVLQSVAVCCSVLQCVAAYMRRVTLCCSVLPSVAVCCNIHASLCSVLQSIAVCGSVWQHTCMMHTRTHHPSHIASSSQYQSLSLYLPLSWNLVCLYFYASEFVQVSTSLHRLLFSSLCLNLILCIIYIRVFVCIHFSFKFFVCT